MKILGLDFETQDDQAKTTRITEVGASLIDVGPGKNPTRVYTKLEGFSALCYEPDCYTPQTEKIIEITSITDDMLKAEGRTRKSVFEEQLLPIVEKADIVMAHKTAFDRTVFESTCKLLGLPVPVKHWFCTLTDIDWPAKYTCRKLSHLAYEHGIMVDPRTLHRAENDVDLMLQLVTTQFDLEDLLAWQALPWVYLRADILGPWNGPGGDGGIQKGIAQSLGFSWENVKGMDEPKFPKWWVTRVKENKVQAIMDAARDCVSPFRVGRINGVC